MRHFVSLIIVNGLPQSVWIEKYEYFSYTEKNIKNEYIYEIAKDLM